MALFWVSGDGGRAGEPVSRGKWEFDMDVDAVELLRAVKRGMRGNRRMVLWSLEAGMYTMYIMCLRSQGSHR